MDFSFDFDNTDDKTDGNKIRCILSDFKLGSMRNVWQDGKNPRRERYLEKVYPGKRIINIELVHSQTIVVAHTKEDAEQIEKSETKADGILTDNLDLVPVVTVADCMPIFVWANSKKGIVFGVLHSGWKGTGIAGNAIDILEKRFGVNKADIHFALGPHIRNCCYSVDEERAEYFRTNFSSDCIKMIAPSQKKTDSEKLQYALSLEKANLALLEKYGIPKENIKTFNLCTCCSKDEDGNPRFGSFRREKLLEGKEKFSAMAASISITYR